LINREVLKLELIIGISGIEENPYRKKIESGEKLWQII